MVTPTFNSMRLGYARISTADQDHALQLDALAKAGCDKVYTETASGKLASRPALDELLAHARAGDTIVVWRLDRLGRSLRHLIDLVGHLDERGIALHSLTEAIDTNTAASKLLFHIMGALAEFERALIIERTRAGLAAAEARGRRGGRPTVWTPEKAQTARAMHQSGEHDISSIARILGVSRTSVYRTLEKTA